MQLASLLKREASGAPLWAWLLGLLPWIWIIPFNQYFWDDWYTADLKGWEEQLARWDGGGKHYLTPLTYFLLLPVGAWIFHIFMVGFSLIGALSFHEILAKTRMLPGEVARWSGPFFLAMPVFHARFAAAVLEYGLGLTAALTAWALLLRPPSVRRWLASFLLLAYAIGTPSLAIIFPLIWLHSAWLPGVSCRSNGFRLAVRNLHVLLIPVFYVFVFQSLLNTRSRYGVVAGGIFAFGRGLLVLITMIAVLAWLTRHFEDHRRRSWYKVSLAASFTYFGLFPYFAVGYNPLAHLLPWRMADGQLDAAYAKLPVILSLLVVTGFGAFSLAGGLKRRSELLSAVPSAVAVVGLSLSAVLLGPMGWESRHWIVSWPALVLVVLTLIATAHHQVTKPLLAFVFCVLLASSLLISSEYLVDSLKQKELIRAVHDDLRTSAQPVNETSEVVAVVIDASMFNRVLDARFRGYASYEWKALIARGLDLSVKDLRVINKADVEGGVCDESYRAILIHPEVENTRVNALINWRVRVKLNAEQLLVCSIDESDGWGGSPSEW